MAQGHWTQCKPGKGERRGGQLASERSQWEGQAADYRYKIERDTGTGNFDNVNDGYVNSRIASTSEESESILVWIGEL